MGTEDKNKEKSNAQNIAPDGGWGWMIVFSVALNNVIVIPIIQNFGLIFRDVLSNLKMTGTDISTIINVNSSFGLLLGLMNGPLMRTFGFRKVAIVGALLLFTGNTLTSNATTFTEFLIFYGIINSLGVGLMMSALMLALNTYWVQRRSLAAGLSMTVTGLGPVFMPLVISQLMAHFGVHGAALILAGLSLHSLLAAICLQPVKWHYKSVFAGEEEIRINPPVIQVSDEDQLKECVDSLNPVTMPRRISNASSIGLRASLSASHSSLAERGNRIGPESHWWSTSNNSLRVAAETDEPVKPGVESMSKEHTLPLMADAGKETCMPAVNDEMPLKGPLWYHKVVVFFDLDLLSDPVYRNIWIGLSIAFTGELNFSLLSPFIFGDRNLSRDHIARLLAIIAAADISSRFVSPFIGNRVKLPARCMYMVSIAVLIVFRIALTQTYSYNGIIVVCVGLGIAKGFRSVYSTLVIPNHVPLDKLASASGLQTVLNGALLMIVGPMLGYVRDVSGDYNICIHIINCLTLTTIVMWSIEFYCSNRTIKQCS